MLPEEVTKFIGRNTGISVFEVEKEPIRRAYRMLRLSTERQEDSVNHKG